MESQQKIRWVTGVIGLGVVAALPFARWTPEPLAQALTSDAPVSIVRDAPRIATEITASPAVGLQDHDLFQQPVNMPAIPTIGRSQLDDQGLPPELPERYHSRFEVEPQPAPIGRSLSRPSADNALPIPFSGEMSLDQPKIRPAETELQRTHRVVDGDTLARWAKRYWGDEQLAEALFAANRATLQTPDPLPLGVLLNIPARPPQPAAPSIEPQPLPAPTVVKQPIPSEPSTEPLTPIPAGAFGR